MLAFAIVWIESAAPEVAMVAILAAIVVAMGVVVTVGVLLLLLLLLMLLLLLLLMLVSVVMEVAVMKTELVALVLPNDGHCKVVSGNGE